MFPSMYVCCVARLLTSDSFEVPVKEILWERRKVTFALAPACVLIHSFRL